MPWACAGSFCRLEGIVYICGIGGTGGIEVRDGDPLVIGSMTTTAPVPLILWLLRISFSQEYLLKRFSERARESPVLPFISTSADVARYSALLSVGPTKKELVVRGFCSTSAGGGGGGPWLTIPALRKTTMAIRQATMNGQ